MSEAAFLSAIAANPDDDTARLVFADWLDEQGRPGRAAFVRAQVQLANLDEADPRYPALLAQARRSGVLTDPDQRFDFERVPGGKVAFRRGLASGLAIDTAALLAVPSDRFRLFPLEQLRLFSERVALGVGAELATRPELAKLHTLVLGFGLYAPHLTPLLTGCSHLTGLRALAAGRVWTPDIAARLALPSLDSLSVEVDDCSSRVWEDEGGRHEQPPGDWRPYLPASGPTLRRVQLSGWHTQNVMYNWEWPGPSADWLTGTRHGPTLELADVWMHVTEGYREGSVRTPPPGKFCELLASCRLRHFRCHWEGLRDLTRVREWGSLDSLAVHNDMSGLHDLARAPQAINLRRLIIDATGEWLDIESADIGARDPFPNLRHLAVFGASREWIDGPHRSHLLRLDVGDLDGIEPVQLVVETDLPEVLHLTLNSFDRINSETAFAALADHEGLPNICTLVVSTDTPFTQTALEPLATSPHLPHLSLVGRAEGYGGTVREWWVIGGGTATPVSPDVIPTEEDWWEPDPLAGWFW